MVPWDNCKTNEKRAQRPSVRMCVCLFRSWSPCLCMCVCLFRSWTTFEAAKRAQKAPKRAHEAPQRAQDAVKRAKKVLKRAQEATKRAKKTAKNRKVQSRDTQEVLNPHANIDMVSKSFYSRWFPNQNCPNRAKNPRDPENGQQDRLSLPTNQLKHHETS